jgi:pimeloyl-ACP methyl ester carboxylesterase
MKPTGISTRTALFTILLCSVLALSAIFAAACSEDEPSTTTSVTVEQPATTAGVEQSTTVSQPAEVSEPEVVTFATEDGLTLSGRLYDPAVGGEAYWSADSGVVLCHMYPADQTSWHEVAEYFAENGLSVLTFDFRGYGDSEGSKDIQYIDRDAAAAAQFLGGTGVQEVVLIGASMGGTASLKAAADLQALSSLRIAGVITLSAPVEFMGLSAEQAVPQLAVPMLFVSAEQDEGASGARALEQLSGGAGELEILAGGGHGTNLFDGPSAEQVWNLMLDFLTENLSAAS